MSATVTENWKSLNVKFSEKSGVPIRVFYGTVTMLTQEVCNVICNSLISIKRSLNEIG